jgi:xylan 1,4-beta-xylosidase
MYSSYTAASFARKYALADLHQVNFKGAVSGSVEFEDQPWFYGFRDLATNGVDKPVLNVFRMFGKMSGQRVEVKGNLMYPTLTVRDSSVRKTTPDVGGLAAKDQRKATVLFWNYHDDDVSSAASPVQLTFDHLPAKKVKITHYRIDSQHSNSYEVWKKMGSPTNPTPEQIKELEKAGQLAQLGAAQTQTVQNNQLIITTSLERQGVGLVVVEW